MTLIAAFDSTRPVLFSDVLLSQKRPTVTPVTPVGTPIDPRLYERELFRPASFQQKTAILQEGRIAVAVAGDFTRAKQAACKLRDDARNGLVEQAGLQAWCLDATRQFSDVSMIIAWCEDDGRWILGSVGTHMMHEKTRSGATIHWTGSGTDWLTSAKVWLGRILEQVGDLDEPDRIIMQVIGQSGMQLFSERAIGVRDNFGGGCQITHMTNGRFHHVQDVTYLHWDIFHTPTGAAYRTEFYPTIVRQTFRGPDLVFEVLRMHDAVRSETDGWTEYRGRILRDIQAVPPLLAGCSSASMPEWLRHIRYYHLQLAHHWQGSLIELNPSVMLHEGSAACAVELVTGEDDVCLRVRSSTLLAMKLKVKITKRWKERRRKWIAAGVPAITTPVT